MSDDMKPREVQDGLKIPATGNPHKTGTKHDQWLSITAGPSHNLDDDEPEVHLDFEGCCGSSARGWFKVADLELAIAVARSCE